MHGYSNSQFSLVMNRGSSAVGTWRSMPVFIKKIGSRKVTVSTELRKEIFNMRELRHPKLVEFVGVCLAQPNICIVTGNHAQLSYAAKHNKTSIAKQKTSTLLSTRIRAQRNFGVSFGQHRS